MTTPRRASAFVDEAFALLGEAIVDGRLRPGDHLRDVELAAQMGISRTPVREALQRLERLGLIEVAPNRYTRVTALSHRTRADMREYATQMMATMIYLGLPTCTDEQIAEGAARVDAMARAETSAAYVAAVVAVLRHFTGVVDNVMFSETLRQTDFVLRRNLEGWERPADPSLIAALRTAIAARETGAAAKAALALHRGRRRPQGPTCTPSPPLP